MLQQKVANLVVRPPVAPAQSPMQQSHCDNTNHLSNNYTIHRNNNSTSSRGIKRQMVIDMGGTGDNTTPAEIEEVVEERPTADSNKCNNCLTRSSSSRTGTIAGFIVTASKMTSTDNNETTRDPAIAT